jgi:hypothetical protein
VREDVMHKELEAVLREGGCDAQGIGIRLKI